jgi:HAD superfamily hydrolase (TIGR01484 family)
MHNKILLCTDLDRTILPNGPQEESPQARPLLRALAAQPELTLAYVSGRHKELLLEAIREFNIPIPDYAIGDVGTTIYEIRDGEWCIWDAWSAEIAVDWRGLSRQQLEELLSGIDSLRLQEAEKQNVFKLSYYAPLDTDRSALLHQIKLRLDAKGVFASLIWSVDEMAGVGLLDVLPRRATKLHAIEFLMQEKGFDRRHTVFAGDSGNDLPVLTSSLQSVLVRNASEEVRSEAIREAEAAGCPDKLYLAKGQLMGMNGNYAAGVLEGLVHFRPETMGWMQPAD